MELRLQKFIADCGICSRRKAEDLILQGRVSVNGLVESTLGTKIDPSIDAIEVDGKAVDRQSIQKLYILFNKPRSCVTTVSDPQGRKTVVDFMPEVSERIYPVGRLDYLSEGLLLLTNDGEMANKVMHPSYEVIKVYEVKVFGAVTDRILKGLRQGANIDGVQVKPRAVRIVKQLQGKTWLEFRLGEGKNREIRRICEAHRLTVDKLKRVAIGTLTVDGIAPGKYVFLTKKEIERHLGFDGKSDGPVEYFSPKKSVNLKKKGIQPNASLATDERFSKFRRETYFTTLKSIKESKALTAAKATKEKYEEKEKAFQERKKKKALRIKKKEHVRLHNQKTVHAVIEK